MQSVYFVFAHPFRHRSRVNATVLERVSNLPHVTVTDLYETYPDFHLNVEREKAMALEHDVLFLQHPFLWYGMPPLLKLWFDEVFEFGLAYGPQGTAFRNKIMQLSVTAGGPKEAYCRSGKGVMSISEYTKPYEETAAVCGMGWARPLVYFSNDGGASIMGEGNEGTIDRVEAHAERVRDLVLSYTNPEYRKVELEL
jgi:glutathione-regulated potassium-efflux system ancillary protein KefG